LGECFVRKGHAMPETVKNRAVPQASSAATVKSDLFGINK
jgi:hypothetical protein